MNWTLITGIILGAGITTAVVVIARFGRIQDRKHAAVIASEKAAAAGDLGWMQVRSILDGGSTPAAYQDAVLDEMEKEFRQ